MVNKDVIELNEANFDREVLNATRPVLVSFGPAGLPHARPWRRCLNPSPRMRLSLSKLPG